MTLETKLMMNQYFDIEVHNTARICSAILHSTLVVILCPVSLRPAIHVAGSDLAYW